jgi:hypothetical protein
LQSIATIGLSTIADEWSGAELKTVKAKVARHHVRDEIQRRILSGETKPG